jgi:hypothetical protein
LLSSVYLFKIIYTYIYDDFFLKFVFLSVNEMENILKKNNNIYIYRFVLKSRQFCSGSSCTTTIMLSSRQPSQLHTLALPALPRRSIQSMTYTHEGLFDVFIFLLRRSLLFVEIEMSDIKIKRIFSRFLFKLLVPSGTYKLNRN